MEKPDIAIWEDDYRGATLAMVEILARHIFEKTRKPVLLFSSGATFRSAAYQVYFKPLEGQFIPVEVAPNYSDGNLLDLWRQFGKIERELKDRGIFRLLLGTADGAVKMFSFARLFGWKPGKLDIRCCVLYLGIAYPGRKGLLVGWRDRLALWLKTSAPVKAFYLDYWAVERVREKFGISLSVCPEPLLSLWDYLKVRPERPVHRERKGICFGFPGGASFGDRKGPDFLIDAFLQADLPPDTCLTFAGYFFDPLLLDVFEKAGERLGDRFKVYNGYLPNMELFNAMDQMDVICLPYRNHAATSGFFHQGATLGKVVVAPDYGWLGATGRKYNKTVFFENDSLSSLAKALEKTAREFPSLDSLAGNYIPTSEEDFVRVLAGVD